jgi:hypothetical protein
VLGPTILATLGLTPVTVTSEEPSPNHDQRRLQVGRMQMLCRHWSLRLRSELIDCRQVAGPSSEVLPAPLFLIAAPAGLSRP